ncbi:MAG TPA: hypothetical protein VI072_22095 [Polyangiaceae bacterium]
MLRSVDTGLVGDDYYTRVILKGIPLPGTRGGPFDLFTFSTPELNAAQQDIGLRGWWADPLGKVSFFRPLSSLTHALDYALWPDSATAHHAHNVLWFGFALVLLSFIYDSIFGSAWPGRLALFLFAFDDSHAFGVSWVANRNLLVAFALGLLMLWTHIKARQTEQHRFAVLASVAFGASLLAGESALTTAAYVLCYALLLDGASRRSRALSLLPYAVVFVAWRILYRALGYGSARSGLLLDPLSAPLDFLQAALHRFPALLSAQLALPPSELWHSYPVVASWLPAVMLAWMIALIAGCAWLVLPLLRSDPRLQFCAAGFLLSALPFCATVPHDRLLFAPGIGAMALLAFFVAAALARAPTLLTSRLRARVAPFAAAATLIVHGILSPMALSGGRESAAKVARFIGRTDEAVPDDPSVEQKSAVLLNPPLGDAFGGYLPLARVATGRHRPKHVRWLATGVSAVHVERVDERTLRVQQDQGYFKLDWELLHRSRHHPMPLGHQVKLRDVTIVITRLTEDGRPFEIEARFTEKLESAKLIFLAWAGTTFQRFKPPRIGERVTLPKVDYLKVAR